MRWQLLILILLAMPAATRTRDYTPELKASTFDKAWTLVARHYWDRARIDQGWDAARRHFRALAIAAPDRRAFYTILGEMLASLQDSHVYAIDPFQIAIGEARDAGRAGEGFGFTMTPDFAGRWIVRHVTAGSSAAEAGVLIGWEVRSVGGRPIDIDYLPAEGEQIGIEFADEEGATHALRLTAAAEAAQSSRYLRRLPNGVCLIGLSGFATGDDRWIAAMIEGGPAPDAVILDLRGNEGGDADVVARVAGRFFAEDRPLVRQIGASETIQTLRGAGRHAYTGPLAVIVDGDSASGAEALAALVEESGRGITIGERTAGALTGAAEYRLPDGGRLSVAEFDIRTPGGVRLENVGFQPRIVVKPSLADLRAGRDPVLVRALQALDTATSAARR